jgi:hypothetical protein
MMGVESSLEAAVVAVRQAKAWTQNLQISLTQDEAWRTILLLMFQARIGTYR